MLRLSWVSSLRRRRRRAPTSSVAIERRKLRGAGFDEDAVRRQDKAELIGYIARPESEIYDHQHNLGLILLECKELTSKYEQLKASSEATEIMLKRQQVSQQSSLADTRKRVKSLKRKLAIQKECISNLERAAEVKVEAKLAEALQLIEMVQKKFDEAEEELVAAKSLEAENASKEKEINLLRKSLDDTQKKLHEKEQSLLKEVLLNQRDENILERLGYVTQSEKRLEEEKLNLEDERKVLLEEKNKLDLNMQEIISREEAIIQKESVLEKRESELLVLQKTIASKERAEMERLCQEQEFDTKIDIKLASFEEETDARKTLLDQRETALSEQEDAAAQREQNLNLRLAELASKEESLVKKSDELREEEKRLSCGKLKNGGVENLKENDVHMSPDGDKNSGPKHSIVKKLELSPVSTPIFWVRKCAQVIFKRSPKSADPHNDGLLPAKLANVNDSSLAAAYSDGHQLENGAGEVPQTKDGLKVGKKRLNNVLSHGDTEILQPKRKQRRSNTHTFRVIGGDFDSNCSPSVLEGKCSKNEHDAVPVGLCGKGPHSPQEGKLVSSDVHEGNEHSKDISVSAAEPSNGHRMVDSEDKDEQDEDPDDEGDEEEKTSPAKIWRFLIT